MAFLGEKRKEGIGKKEEGGDKRREGRGRGGGGGEGGRGREEGGGRGNREGMYNSTLYIIQSEHVLQKVAGPKPNLPDCLLYGVIPPVLGNHYNSSFCFMHMHVLIYENSTIQLTSVELAQACPNNQS